MNTLTATEERRYWTVYNCDRPATAALGRSLLARPTAKCESPESLNLPRDCHAQPANNNVPSWLPSTSSSCSVWRVETTCLSRSWLLQALQANSLVGLANSSVQRGSFKPLHRSYRSVLQPCFAYEPGLSTISAQHMPR
jgi:hypothetical protein